MAALAKLLMLHQVGAVPIRREEENGLSVLLITSRETKRWIVPKGWPMLGRPDYRAAAIEAREEAGVVGRVHRFPVGHYDYLKIRPGRTDTLRVVLYLLEVQRHLKRWREQGQREVRWFPAEEAAEAVLQPELASVIRGLSTN
ncbi:NUDIX hydrolase [Micromonospora sp. STR1s_5]|nr:NUDIX hydrolase [Micromonospora sp. STR1s_5]